MCPVPSSVFQTHKRDGWLTGYYRDNMAVILLGEPTAAEEGGSEESADDRGVRGRGCVLLPFHPWERLANFNSYDVYLILVFKNE